MVVKNTLWFILAFAIALLLAMSLPNKEQEKTKYWLVRTDGKEVTEELVFDSKSDCEEQQKYNADFDSKKGIVWKCQKRTEKIIK